MIDEATVPPKEPAFRLDRLDLDSRTWKRLRAHLEGQLHKARRQNDNDIDPIRTAKLRGRILVIKDLLALGDPQPRQVVADEEQPE